MSFEHCMKPFCFVQHWNLNVLQSNGEWTQLRRTFINVETQSSTKLDSYNIDSQCCTKMALYNVSFQRCTNQQCTRQRVVWSMVWVIRTTLTTLYEVLLYLAINSSLISWVWPPVILLGLITGLWTFQGLTPDQWVINVIVSRPVGVNIINVRKIILKLIWLFFCEIIFFTKETKIR